MAIIESITRVLLLEHPDYKTRFASLETNLDRMNFIYADMEKRNLFPKLGTDSKDDSAAVKHRENGNKHFASGNHLRAMEDYTRSAAAAKSDTILALAYANRSTCLYKLRMHRACITDINRAFASNYSGERRMRLISRRNQAEKLVKPAESYHEEIPKIPDSQKNSLIQSASSCVRIESDEEFGRHVVATRTIEIGEVVSVERAFACVVRSDELVHCHNCLQLCYNLIPCESCTQALYCGEGCRDEARDSYHEYECPVLLAIAELEIKWILIALKVALLARGDYGRLNTFRFNKNEYYRSDRYKEIHNLTAPVRKVFDPRFFYKTVSAVVVFNLLKTKTNLFESVDMEDSFKEVFLFQLEVAAVNGLNIYEYVPASDSVCYEGSDFAGGIYSFSSLFNHSCCRNLHRISYGSTLVIRAINTIQKGQQCFINYGAHYDIAGKSSRQLTLATKFSFVCKCRACEEDWESHFMDFSQALGIPMCSLESINIQKSMSTADVNFAKKFLPRCISLLKKNERSEPWGKALTLKRMVFCCYETLGNKRRL